tara:strand:+ start:3404 stop:5239 length:1836 start_codon:yes stop_codon:yes gene_type:complete
MKKFYKSQIILALSMIFTFAASNQANAQCAITGLAEAYCLDALPVFLAGTPPGGTFSGPGVSGELFYPEDAGVGVHTISYEYIPGGDRYYIKSSIGNPWGQTTTDQAFDLAFGPGEWMLEAFETVDVEAVFTGSTSMIYMDGSQNQSTELAAFLSANLTAIEEWVDAGGVICINAAPNEGGDINFGFGGVSLDYPSVYLSTVTMVDPVHPTMVGPQTPTSTTMTGTSYCHGRILGPGLTNVLVSGSEVGLAEKDYGDGHVMFGSMTVAYYHNPDPQAANFQSNLMTYMDDYIDFEPCVVTMDVEVLDAVSPDIVGESDIYDVCLGEEYTLTGSGAEDFYWGGGIIDGEPIMQDAAGTYTHILTGISDEGCVATSAVTVSVHPNPIVDGGFDLTQCAGMDLILSGAGATTYEWDPSVVDGEPFEVTEGLTTYTVTGTSEFGCESTDEVVVEGIGGPVVTAVITDEYELFGASIDITVTGGSGPYGYAWSHGPTTEDVTGLYEGTYTVDVSDSGVEEGICPPVSETYTIIRFVGVEDLTENTLTVYPTPVNDNVTISYVGDFNYELTAINGDIIFSGKAVDQEIISMEELAAGTYLIKVTSNVELTTKKIVKQ